MSGGRLALVITCLVVTALGGWFAVAKWDQANKIATVASALGAVAAVGVAIWTALRSTSSRTGRAGGFRVVRTGRATATGAGSSAVTGVRGKGADRGHVTIRDTGDAEANAGGNAVSGIHDD